MQRRTGFPCAALLLCFARFLLFQVVKKYFKTA